MFLSSTYNIYSSFLHRPKIRKPSHRDCINVPLTFCCEYDGCFTNCVNLYYWFIVARCLGLFHCLSPRWRPKGTSSKQPIDRLDPHLQKPRKPPDRYHRGHFVLLAIYLFIVLFNTKAVYYEEMNIQTLSVLPLTILSGIILQAIHQRENRQAISELFAPLSSIHDGQFIADPCLFPPHDSAPSNATKLSMLSAWQSANARSPIYMDYAPGSKAICVDTGASSCISNDKNDFILLETVQNQTITGIGSGLTIAGHGTLRWKIKDDDGNTIILHVSNALYVPQVPMCLLCPQQIAQQTGKEHDGFRAEAKFGTLTYDGFVRTIPYNGRNGLPIIFTTGDQSAMFSPFQTENASPHLPRTSAYADSLLSTATAYTGELNLTRTQRLLLLVHASMAHLHLDEVQQLARAGFFGDSLRCIGSCDKPLCHACCIGKPRQRSISTTGTPLKAAHLKPGDCVSSDQLESNAPGRVAVWKGNISTSFYQACTFFIDHASNKVHITLNFSTGAEEAVESKRRFERMASDYNVQIKKYHADNGVYASKVFKSSCDALNQTYDFSGVGAKHQNGVAERMIGTITRRARTMLLHATILWPSIISEDLWPFALKMAVDVHNATPGPSGLSPDEIFSGHKSSRNRLKDFHPFGCPVFVLEASLQNGHKVPKWKPRSRMAIYLGNSPDHATSVPLVMNTSTGLVSPQYHLVFDDSFTTTKSLETNNIPTNWPELFKYSETNLLDPDQETHHKLDASWHEPTVARPIAQSKRTRTIRFIDELELQRSPSPSSESSDILSTDIAESNSIDETESLPIVSPDLSEQDPPLNPSSCIRPGKFSSPKDPIARKNWNTGHPYSTRFKRTITANVAALESTLENEENIFSLSGLSALLAEQEAIFSNSDETSEIPFKHFAFAAASEDTLHYGQMRKDPDRAKFELDMQREVSDLLSSDSVKIVERSAMPKASKPVPAIWSFRRKRAPDWTITKWKARLCPHGGKQVEGIDFWETYALVIAWSTVRLILILSMVTGM